MMGYTMQVRKDRDGWRAETYIELRDIQSHGTRDGKPGVTKLSISTSKRSRGLSSFASVAFHGEDGFTLHAMGLGTGLGDYGKTVALSGARATEKAVRDLHVSTLARVEEIIEEARAHYAAQEAKRAAEKVAA